MGRRRVRKVAKESLDHAGANSRLPVATWLKSPVKWSLGAIGTLAVSFVGWNLTVDQSQVSISEPLFYDEGAEFIPGGGVAFGGQVRIDKTRGAPLRHCTFVMTARESRTQAGNHEGLYVVANESELPRNPRNYAVVYFVNEEDDAQPFRDKLKTRSALSGRVKFGVGINHDSWRYLTFTIVCDNYRSQTLVVDRYEE